MKKPQLQPISFDPSSILNEALKQVKKDAIQSENKIYDIISFSKNILDQKPFPAQELILKFFYAGTRYNESLRITDDDIQMIRSWEFPQPWLLDTPKSKINALQKNIENFKSNPGMNYFRELVLILGRRSGKSWLSSIVSIYEAYKLISLRDPVKKFGMDGDIWIINTAINAAQAESIVFKQIKKFAHKTPIIEDRICKETNDTLILYTDADIETNERIIKNGGNPLQGSVVISSGTSNSASLRGHSSCMVVMDEMAHYVDTAGKAAAKSVYNALTPSVSNLYNFGEGRCVIISSPDTPNGFFFDHFESSKLNDHALVFQIPTWDVNPNYTRELLEPEFQSDPDKAITEFGAQFRQKASARYFPPELVEEARTRKNGWVKQVRGVAIHEYYMHIDPARNSDRWAVIIAHSEYRMDVETRTRLQWMVEDYSITFKPDPGKYLDPEKIMNDYIFPLFKNFKIISVTSDTFFSVEQQNKFRQRGIRYKELCFNGPGKNKLYESLKDYIINGRIELCNDDYDLAGEMKNIIVDYDKNPPRFDKIKEDNEFPNDDLVDCLSGVVFSMLQGIVGSSRLPKGGTVYMRNF